VKERTWEEYPDYESSFVSSPENFLQSVRGLPYFENGWFKFHRRDLVSIPDIIYEKHSFVERFRKAKVLVIGAGPSVRDNEWSPEGYDLICSCNHFYLYDRVRPLVDFAVLNDEVFLLDKNLVELKTVYCFENANRDVSWFYNKHFERTMLAHTRYLSKIGSAARLICMATLWGASEVHIIGIDGERAPDTHIFEPTKPITGFYNLEIYKRQYGELWDYLRRIGLNTKFVNLGYGHKFNISSRYLDDKGNWLS